MKGANRGSRGSSSRGCGSSGFGSSGVGCSRGWQLLQRQ